MNKTTIKISVLAFLGFITYGYAQQQQQDPYRGKVGVNTIEPSATMDVQPNSDNARVEAKTNEGIIAPKLSKTRIANIAAPVEGTLVYATDATYTVAGDATVDNRVAKITEKGYYYYNGTEWVKAGSDSAEQIWIEKDGNKVSLKSSLIEQDVHYTPKGFYRTPKNKTSVVDYDYNTNQTIDTSFSDIKQTDFSMYSSSGKEYNRGLDGNQSFDFISNRLEVDGLKDNTGANSNIVFHSNNVTIPPSYPLGVRLLRTGFFSATKLNDGATSELTALGTRALDAGAGNTGTIIGTSGSVMLQKSAGIVSNIHVGLTRLDILSQNKANVTNLIGSRVHFKVLGSGNITNMYAYAPRIEANDTFTGTVTNYYDYYADGHPTQFNVTNRYGIYISGANKINYLESNLGIGTKEPKGKIHAFNERNVDTPLLVLGTRNNTNNNVSKAIELYTDNPASSAKINVVRGINSGFTGFAFSTSNSGITEEAMRITPTGNIGVGTITPSEKLDVAGSIKSTALAGSGNRPVYADAEGKLVIGSSTTIRSAWVPDTASNSVQLAITSANGDRTTHPISITDEGMVRATSFQGVNGATIFPDYVFQKYYTGTSSIKADYNFKSLSQVEDFVKANGHLPGYKSAETIKAQGYVDLMETQLTNVEKIEELYLHSIEQDKVNKQQAEALRAKDAEIADLKQRLERLEKLIQ
ncbi:hypothetical protein [Bergeyella zoohelcum]|uniref:Peptidase S74 domain-containing protein n=1 Tax=Bergeyella zoohelcum ATCC 43767 TaxID=883096 RepID=K1LHR0_9FLAO|nr:hypothetical protein [Bergeyella zoohelcum]EKB54186.1 hypothetical protein HMPREF9699_01998 [Bergeyella zoohelcum ATCC 43767]SUV49927.1 Uncharacterised protein [Bergeyella zoohelcum]